MAKVYEIPLNRGYGGSLNDGEMPEGFWSGKNMIYREDGALRGRWTFQKKSGIIGSSNNWIREIYHTNNNYIVICGDGKAYYGESGGSFTECTWTGAQTKPDIHNSYRGNWASLNELPIFTDAYTHPLIFTSDGTSFQYLTGSSLDCTKSYNIIEHQNRILMAGLASYGSMIRFSDLDDPNNGYSSNYVNVGDEKEKITGIHHLSGNLIVIKENAIWAKIGTYSDLTSDQFQPVFQGISSLQSSSVVGKNLLYFADESGVYSFSGGDINQIDTFSEEWFSRPSLPGTNGSPMAYWRGKDWLWVANGSSYEEPLVYDVNRKAWYKFDGFNPQCFINNYGTFIFGQYGGSGKCYIFEYGIDLNHGSAEEESFEQELITPFLDLGSPYSQKYLRKILLYAGNVDQVDVYFKTDPAPINLDTTTPAYTIESPSDSEEINIGASTPFRQLCIKLSGSGDMTVKNLAVVYDERR